MQTLIIADSTCDILSMDGQNFISVPLTISTEERTFTDDENINVDEMLDYLSSYRGRSRTACPSVDDWLKRYEGFDVIYAVVLSSGISGTYNAAVTAADIYREEHPDAKIKVFDTLSAGPEVRLLCDKIAEFVREGKDFDEVCRLAEFYTKHTRVFFALKSFHNFAQNGRVSKVVAAAAGVLNICVLATASLKGEIEIVSKCRGEKGTIKGFLDCLKKSGYNGGKVYISHCKGPEFAASIARAIKEQYETAKITVYETRGLCSYYAEKGGMLLSCECDIAYE